MVVIFDHIQSSEAFACPFPTEAYSMNTHNANTVLRPCECGLLDADDSRVLSESAALHQFCDRNTL